MQCMCVCVCVSTPKAIRPLTTKGVIWTSYGWFCFQFMVIAINAVVGHGPVVKTYVAS